MENQELLTAIKTLLEENNAQLLDDMRAVVREETAANNAAVGVALTEALEPLTKDIQEIRDDLTLLRADNAKNTLDIARLKIVK